MEKKGLAEKRFSSVVLLSVFLLILAGCRRACPILRKCQNFSINPLRKWKSLSLARAK